MLAVYFTWVFLAKAPPPIDVIAEWEAEEAAEKEAKAAAKAAKAANSSTEGRHRAP